MVEAYVGLGSNMGDAEGCLREALDALSRMPGALLDKVSPLYRTEPQGMADQPWFVNAVARLRCAPSWTAELFLEALLATETRLGRVRSSDPALRFGPRTIDLDLLLFGEERRTSPRCTLPHPRLAQRAFVLVPLRDIAPRVIIADGITVTQALEALSYTTVGGKIYQ